MERLATHVAEHGSEWMRGLLARAMTWPAVLAEAVLRRTGWYARACELLYSELAWAYDAAAWLVSSGRWDSWRRLALNEALASGPFIVELGPGTGHGLLYLSERGAVVVGIEPSPQMLAQARRRARRVTLVRGRSQQIPLRDGMAAAVVCTFPGNWITDPVTWAEIERVLRPGGRAVFLENSANNPLLMLARRLCGHFGIPKWSTDGEYPLRRAQIAMLATAFGGTCSVRYPFFEFFRLLDQKLIRYRSRTMTRLCEGLDSWLWRVAPALRQYSYKQVVVLYT